jgi:uncharacterized protein (DUF2235 family)
LVYFIDGTWLWAGSQNTLDVYSNVYLMNTLLEVDDAAGHAQIVGYSRGLGAIGGVRRYIDGGFANGIDVLIADLYVNICSNYQPDDKIYIFGFSRGAVVARALAGLLAKGILNDKYVNSFADIWGDYLGEEEVLEPGLQDDRPRTKKTRADYKSLLSDANPPIEFLGVFDTVSGGRGLSEIAQRLRITEGRLPANVKNALQILAIDETRSFFRPVLWTRESTSGSFLEQIWMPGVHSDVGGAFAERTLGNVALITMIDRVLAKTGLKFDLDACREYNRKLDPAKHYVRVHNERALMYWKFFNPWPVTRRVNRSIDQTIHPLANYLRDKVVLYKSDGNRLLYPLPWSFERLSEQAPEFLTRHFQSIFP